ncbi:unnamed protein product [Caenorhabditis angaria]|uniref:Uncharacterized protein n=1 Tax=Caenorhabditis angaria TaxID=860376 RepID=A0A9P1J310_9PELO|nr:unnamed protein product [Caenorhabditis angaria]
MTQSKYLDSLNDWRFIFWFLFPFLYGLFYGLMIYLFLSQTEEANEMIRDVILYDFDLNIDDIVFLGATIYQKNGSNSKLNWRPICGIAIIWVMIAISSFLMIYFGWSCYNTLQKPTLKSSNFHNLQKQVYYALLTETLIPVVLLHFPVSVLFLFTFYELDIQSISRIFSATIAIFPAVDPLPTMFIIQNYRDAIIRKLKLQKCLKGDQTATAIARHHPRSFQLKRIQTGTIQMVEIKY